MAGRRPHPKNNPDIHGNEGLIRSFVVRLHDYELALRSIRENTASDAPNQHVLFTGPRGAGKTMLVRRIAAEVERDAELSQHWYPIVFAEQSDQVGSPGELWLEALFHLANRTEDPRWLRAYEDLRTESNDETLRDRALAQLLDFADEQGKRFLMVIENLNGLLSEQIPDGADWDLRHTFQNERRIMLRADT